MRSLRSGSLFLLLIICCISLLVSCSGDGTSGNNLGGSVSLSSLVLPGSLSVVDPKTSSSSSSKAIGSFAFSNAVLADLPLSTDYRSDKTTVYVNERSLDSFRSVNEILCMIKQSRYDVMINKGPYKAQVDKTLCSGNRSSASAAGQAATDQSSGSAVPVYENWIIDSFRTNARSPHIVHVWVHPTPGPYEPAQVIDAKIVITEGADTAPPYGIFKMNFKSLDPARTITLFKGFLNAERDPGTNRALLKFATEDKDSYSIEKATLDKDPAGASGSGSVLKVQSFPGREPETDRFDLAYNATNFLRSDISGTQICLDRTNFNISAWRYGLYTTTASAAGPAGTRVNRNSNLQVKKQSGEYGSIGYWGAWFPGNASVTDGETVLKHDYSTNTDTAFTVFKRGGKMKQYTKNNITLADIKNVPLVWFDSGNTFLVIWDDINKVFWKAATMGPNNSWQSITPVVLDLSALNWVEMMFWSQSLGGSVVVKLPPPGANAPGGDCTGTGPFNCTGKATSTTAVVYFKEQLIFPGDAAPARLACFDRCPDTTALGTSNPYRTDILSYQTVTPGLATFASYSFDTNAMQLTNSVTGAPVTAATTTSPYQNGITSGLLFDPSPANLGLLACDWDPNTTCGGKAWTALSEFFVWETGPNTWNQFVTVRDGGTPVKFDPPLQVEYVHSQPTTSAPDAKYDGVKFFLEYTGFGDLHGIPGKCVDVDKGIDADCSQGGSNQAIRWVPEFSIPFKRPNNDLTEVTDLQTSAKYFVKALEVEERMGSAALASCTGLVTSNFTLPSMSSWINPVIGAEPVITAPPAVVGGVVQ